MRPPLRDEKITEIGKTVIATATVDPTNSVPKPPLVCFIDLLRIDLRVVDQVFIGELPE